MSDEQVRNANIAVSLLDGHARNYRSHPPEQIKQLVASLQRFQQVRSIVVKKQPHCERYTILAGHGLVEAARECYYPELRCDIVPDTWDDLTCQAYLIADNNLSNNASDDEALLAELLQEQVDAGYDLESLGSDEESLRQMLADLGDEYLGGDEGEEEEDSESAGDSEQSKNATLAERFIIPPFSVLDARQGYWQERKRAWLALGIQSEIGRGENALSLSPETSEPGLNHYRNENKNGLLGESEQARGHYKAAHNQGAVGHGGLSDQRAGQIGRVGKAQSLPIAPDGVLLIDKYRQDAGERKAKTVKGLLGGSLETIHGYDDGPAGGAVSQSGTSIFDPVLCELAYSWFCPPSGTILDPFAGGSVRGIVAAKLGRHYVGIDLRAEQTAANEEQASTLLRSHPALMLDPADVSLDYTPEYTPVEEHGGYLVKRDDLFQVAGVCGGKVRTCWHLAQESKGLVTAGSRQSPQVNIVAHIAQRLGIPCRVHTPTGELSPEVQAAQGCGAEVIQHKAGYNNVIIARAREDAEAQGWTEIPFGMECKEAIRQTSKQVSNIPPGTKRIVMPVGSGMSLAGVLHGLQMYSLSIPVVGVCVGADAEKRLDEYAPKHWRSMVTLEQSPIDYHKHAPITRLGNLQLDPIYEAKCLPFLKDGDLLWVVGIRQTMMQETSTAPCSMPRWIVGDSRNIPTLCPDVEADLVFTCPPYYDLEVYSDDPQDLSVVSSYDEFIQSYRLILKNAIAQLKENRFVCVVVGDIRDKKGFYRNFVGDTISACQDAGAKLYNEAILVTSVGSLPIRVGKQFSSGRKLGKTHQNVLVFCKGNPQKAVQDCGPVVVHVPEDELEEMEEESVEEIEYA